MNNRPDRYELKLRGEYSGGSYGTKKSGNSHKNNDRMSAKSMICVLIICCTVFLKANSSPGGEAFLSKLDSLITSQFSLSESTEAMSEFAKEAASYFISDTEGLSFALPVREASLLEGFEESTHPVFMTQVAPTGITFAAEPSAYVYSAADGKVTAVSVNGDSSKKIVVKYNKGISLVYDNLSMVYVKEGDDVKKDDIIALLAEESPSKLKFEVWVDNVAVDPTLYFDRSVNKYVPES